MSIMDFNKRSKFLSVDTEGFEYKKLEELYKTYGKDEVYTVRALYINDTKFGKSPVAVGDRCFINLPKHLVGDIEQIINDEELVEQINLGKIGFKIYEFVSRKYNKVCYGIEWVEI